MILDSIPARPGELVELAARGDAIRVLSGVQDGLRIFASDERTIPHEPRPGSVISTPFDRYAVLFPSSAHESVPLVLEIAFGEGLGELSSPPVDRCLIFQGRNINVNAGQVREIPLAAAAPADAYVAGVHYPQTILRRARVSIATSSAQPHDAWIESQLIGFPASTVPLSMPSSSSALDSGRQGAIVLSAPYPFIGGRCVLVNTGASAGAFDILVWSDPS